ncbi:hypothetical protein PhaeoP48_02236 [Phaeobacter inhibens]|nr:hypothetical protein PhaeoP48_02236 [Phaeobacter inhibens]
MVGHAEIAARITDIRRNGKIWNGPNSQSAQKANIL